MFTKETLIFQQSIKDEYEFCQLGAGKGYRREEEDLFRK